MESRIPRKYKGEFHIVLYYLPKDMYILSAIPATLWSLGLVFLPPGSALLHCRSAPCPLDRGGDADFLCNKEAGDGEVM